MGLPKISVRYLFSPGFVNLSCNTVNPSSCSGMQYHGNLHVLLQAEALMKSFVICLKIFNFSGEKRVVSSLLEPEGSGQLPNVPLCSASAASQHV